MWLWAGAVPASYPPHHSPRLLHTAVDKLRYITIALHRYSASMPPVHAVLLFLWCNTRPASFEKARYCRRTVARSCGMELSLYCIQAR